MQIVRTYARVWPHDRETALRAYTELTGESPHFVLSFGAVSLAGIGDFLLVIGPAAAREPFRTQTATVVVDDLGAALEAVARHGGTSTGIMAGPTGSYAFGSHVDGSRVEYVEWSEEFRASVAAAERAVPNG